MPVFALDRAEYFAWCLEVGGPLSLSGSCGNFSPAHSPIFSFLTIPTAQWQPFQICSGPTSAKFPSCVFSPHSSAPRFFPSSQPWPANNRPGDFQSVTHQLPLGAYMLVHVFTHNESFHFMRPSVLSTWPSSLYFIHKDRST